MAWYSIKEAAKILNVSPRTVSRRIAAGIYPIRMSGKRKLVGICEENELIKELKQLLKEVKSERSD